MLGAGRILTFGSIRLHGNRAPDEPLDEPEALWESGELAAFVSKVPREAA